MRGGGLFWPTVLEVHSARLSRPYWFGICWDWWKAMREVCRGRITHMVNQGGEKEQLGSPQAFIADALANTAFWCHVPRDIRTSFWDNLLDTIIQLSLYSLCFTNLWLWKFFICIRVGAISYSNHTILPLAPQKSHPFHIQHTISPF